MTSITGHAKFGVILSQFANGSSLGLTGVFRSLALELSPDPGWRRSRRAAASLLTSAVQQRGCHLSFFIAPALPPPSLSLSSFSF